MVLIINKKQTKFINIALYGFFNYLLVLSAIKKRLRVLILNR